MASRGRLPTNTTSISLHERFSRLKSAAGGQKLAGNVQVRRQATALLQKASSKNHRLAQQMERRTATSATLAALKLKKKSIKQRLGASQPTFSTGSRLRGALTQKQRKLATAGRGGTTVARSGNSNNRAASQTVKATNASVSRGGKRGRAGNKSQRGAVTPKRTAPVTTPTRTGGGRQRGRGRGRGAQNKAVANGERKVANTPGKRGRGGRGGQQGGKVQRDQQSTPRGRGKSSPQRGRGGRGRGRGGRGGQSKPKLSKEDLDKEMDQYMSKTRTALNRDLDSYMSGLPGDVEMN